MFFPFLLVVLAAGGVQCRPLLKNAEVVDCTAQAERCKPIAAIISSVAPSKVTIGSLDCSFIYDDQFSHSDVVYQWNDYSTREKTVDGSVYTAGVVGSAFMNMIRSSSSCNAAAFYMTLSDKKDNVVRPFLISAPCTDSERIRACTWVVEAKRVPGQSCANNGGCQNGSTCMLNSDGWVWCKNCPARFKGSRCEVPVPRLPPPAPVPMPRPVPAPVPVSTNSEQDIYLRVHNEARAAVGVPPLTWSSAVEQSAKEYAQTCPSAHSRSQYGENLEWMGRGSTEEAVRMWVDEKQHYSYSSNTCATGKVCGHYTQVVWRDTTQLGCAKMQCNSLGVFGGAPGIAWVCNYNPPGNYNGRKPY
jgi:pathogenesis-related protein 1